MKPDRMREGRPTHWGRPLIVAAFGALILAGAGRTQQQPQIDLPDGPGKDKVAAACSTCHAITQVTAQARTAPQWAETVDQMVSRGATVSEEDYPIIVDYLAKHFAPGIAPPAGGAPAPASSPKSGQ
jgi:hypothetical protein